MVAGPEQCRRYAIRCMDLAREARTPSVRAQLEDLAHQWRQIASEIEKYREQIDELGLSPDRLVKYKPRTSTDGGEANA